MGPPSCGATRALLRLWLTPRLHRRLRSTLGWTKSNEISNGRWVMFGLLVGMMTEYATGVDFPNQLKLTVSVLGIADVYD